MPSDAAVAYVQARIDAAMSKAIGPTTEFVAPKVDNMSRTCMDCGVDWIGPRACWVCDGPGTLYPDIPDAERPLHSLANPCTGSFR